MTPSGCRCDLPWEVRELTLTAAQALHQLRSPLGLAQTWTDLLHQAIQDRSSKPDDPWVAYALLAGWARLKRCRAELVHDHAQLLSQGEADFTFAGRSVGDAALSVSDPLHHMVWIRNNVAPAGVPHSRRPKIDKALLTECILDAVDDDQLVVYVAKTRFSLDVTKQLRGIDRCLRWLLDNHDDCRCRPATLESTRATFDDTALACDRYLAWTAEKYDHLLGACGALQEIKETEMPDANVPKRA
jgi:hypothetical protein